MARHRKIPKAAQQKTSDDESDNQPDPNPDSEDLIYDDIDKFHRERDKIPLEDAAGSDAELSSDDEEEVMGLDVASSDDEGLSDDVEASDEEEDDSGSDAETGLPGEKAWGKSKNLFYSTDLIDEDMLGSDEEAELAAQEEEEEALSMQKRMTAQLDEEDFDAFSVGQLLPADVNEEEISEAVSSQIVKDLSSLSKEEKLELLVKESPELFEMLDEFKERLTEVTIMFHPLLVSVWNGVPVSDEMKLFIETKHQALLNYCINVSFYLVLKANKELSKTHPVIGRLVQYRMLLQDLDKVTDAMTSEMTQLLKSDSSSHEEPADIHSNKKVLKNLVDKRKKQKRTDKQGEVVNETAVDPMEYYNQIKAMAEQKKLAKKEKLIEGADDYEEDEEMADGKRGITNEMQRNKGMTRRRKKELQNPRVKHKIKFRKAIIRRKGQVRAVVKELKKYGGETTGIKASLTRSVRIK